MKTLFKTGIFKDFEGKERNFVIAAVVYGTKSVLIEETDECFDLCQDIDKILSIGISICHPSDEYNEEKGKLQAEGRALKCRDSNRTRKIAVTNSGILNEEVVTAILNNTAKALASKPEVFSKGYRAAKLKWEKANSL